MSKEYIDLEEAIEVLNKHEDYKGYLQGDYEQILREEVEPVPQEMSAREFVLAKNRMCVVYRRNDRETGCWECPLYDFCDEYNDDEDIAHQNADESVTIVEKWAREHPEKLKKKCKTYAEDFHKKHPNALYDSDGTPRSCKRYIYGVTNTPCKTNGCAACWNEEMGGEDDEEV